ncbi:MtrB/PioB family decaheme-associated outer membrane protein [Shewanella sp. TC10]|uniref:MtrB/PioB family decaheme-associated outer membrane protein n=1 Tax=Shewanella sp. TC10 TaxID=1419739 RepID=UPI001892C628|nr:MtrB/PioB family decaheme-associated outer membrane protein [Shewanella sp. TC10]
MLKYTLTAMAVMSSISVTHAASFALSDVQLEHLNKSNWSCDRCVSGEATGTVGLSVGYTDSQDEVVTNRWGTGDGAAIGVNADSTIKAGEHTLKLQANQLGMDSGFGGVQLRNGNVKVAADYGRLRHYDALTTTTLLFDGNNLVDVSEQRPVHLKQERERFAFGGEYLDRFAHLGWRSYAHYENESKTGYKRSSANLVSSAANIASPVDHTVQQFNAGSELVGEQWLAGVNYYGSLFENNVHGLMNGERVAYKAMDPDNESHQLSVNGQYLFKPYQTRLSGRFVRGWQYQNETQYVDFDAAPVGITHLNGEVETTQADLRLTSRINQVSFSARYRYSDRENTTPVYGFTQDIVIDDFNGRTRYNTSLDITRNQYAFDAQWRAMARLNFELGYKNHSTERINSDYAQPNVNGFVREETDEQSLYLTARLNHFEQWDISATVEQSERSGSSYQANESTSSEDNALLRKYYLADRDRTEVRIDVSYMPLEALTLDASIKYADDDYTDSSIGLLSAEDMSYDLTASLQLSKKLNLYLAGGQQRIEAEQAGSQSFSTPDWRYSNKDNFDYLSTGMKYSGLMDDRLTLGLEYQYFESDSVTKVDDVNDYGDYVQWSHNANLYGIYQLNAKTDLRADYRYERYVETDYANNQSYDNSSSLFQSLGDLGHNNVAHQVMLTLTYKM